MVESSKWVTCDAPGEPAGSVVRDALAGRLAVVAHYLAPQSIEQGHEIEHVHQLRVATRRSGAALTAFAAFLPRRKRKRLRRMLKRIRNAAGEARDLDVMAGRHKSSRKSVPDEAKDWLWARISDARRAARPALDDVYERYGEGRFALQADRLLARVQWRGGGDEPTFAMLAKDQLGAAAGNFFEIARQRPQTAAGQHELRIAAKRFRYALELFAAVAKGLADEVYPVVEEVQQRLGKANDRAVAAQRIATWQQQGGNANDSKPRRGKPAGRKASKKRGVNPQAIAKQELRKAATARKAFLEWWTEERCAALAERYDALMAGV